MKMKKYIIILIILFILINILPINATDNNTTQLVELNDENSIELNKTNDKTLTTSFADENEIETQNNMEENKLSTFTPVSTQITLSINDTQELETTGNITINMQFSFTALEHDGEFTAQNINIYENNTLIKTLNIGEQNLPELEIITGHSASSAIEYKANILFNYTVHDNSYLTTSLFGVYSNTLQFEKIKKIDQYTLNNTNILINNQTIISDNTWTNNINSIKRALELIKNNETLQLNNINILQLTKMTLLLDKNITIIGNNSTFNLQNKGLLFEINPETYVTFINLKFKGNNPDIIYNKGKVKFINCTFEENNLGLITNVGEIEIENCQFKEINQIYLDRPTLNQNGLIKNSGILKITKTLFTNNNELLPYTLPIESERLKAIIYNDGTLTIANTTFENLKDRIIYNEGQFTLINTLMDNINTLSSTAIYKTSTLQPVNNQYTYNTYRIYAKSKSTDGGAIYNNNQTTIINSTLKSITGNMGGAIYNTNSLTIKDTLFNNIQSKLNGTICNLGILNINNTQINNNNGEAISNLGILNINNTQINKSTGSAINNNRILNINNTIITECRGVGAAIYNTNITNIENCQIINNQGLADVRWRYEELPDGQTLAYVDKVYSGVIYNGEYANANIIQSIIKNNIVYSHTNGNWRTYYGNIKNDGILNISGCIFDNNIPYWDGRLNQGDGSFNIYNNGKITVMYSYLLNTKIYEGGDTASGVHSPSSFLYHAGGTSYINYNFYCLNPNDIIKNANPNYYFTPGFDDDYYPIKINQSKNIELTLKLTNGVDTIEFNDWDKLLQPGLNTTITTIDENGAYINITTLLKDKIILNFNYTKIKGEYDICANILNYTATALVDVGKEFANMTITYNNITYNDGNNITFHISLTGNITTPTGNIIITFNNKKTTLNLINGTCSYTVDPTLKPGNYTIKIEYDGNEEYFKIRHNTYPFTIHKISTFVNISAPEIKIGEIGKLTITVIPSTAKMVGYLYCDGKAIDKINTQSLRVLNLKNYAIGVYNFTIKFDEDEYYTGGTASTLFIVSKYKTNLTIESSDIRAGENETLNITITPGDVRGNATLQINGENRSIWINNTITPITLTNLEEGTYHVTVYYFGDAKYAPSHATTTFSVSRITSHLIVTLTQNDNLTGNIKIQTDPLNCTGEVAIYVNNDKITLNLTNGTINTQVKLKRGSNYIYIHYNGDGNYSISTWNTTFSIDGVPLLTLETQDLAADKTGYVRINLTDTNNIPYEYTDITVLFKNVTSVLKTDENGTVYFPVNTKAGIYEITTYYENATITKTLTVKTLTTLTVSIQSINEADDLMVYATLTDSYNNKMTADVVLKINDNYYKVPITNGAGSRNLGEFKHATYTYTAIYQGDTLIYPSNATGSFQVKTDSYKITGNKNINQYYGATKTYKIRLLNNNQPVKGEIITVKIGKNTVKVKTNNQGYATLKLNLKAGKYTITSTYKNVKVSNKITVKPTLITKNKKIKKGKTLTYTAKLLNKNGKALKNKKITFKIKGKKYKAKTNKKGVAKIKVKNLKKGKYKITTTYKKQKNTNTITVKK